MTIEKLNDYQIRCTLTSEDLASRQLKVSELVTGSDKAKVLFREMMQQASSELGFETDDMPLMIEAVPTTPDSLVIIVTKVNRQLDLESKLMKLLSALDADLKRRLLPSRLEGAETNVNENASAAGGSDGQPVTAAKIRLFSFSDLDNVIGACKLLQPSYVGASILYKDVEAGSYILLLAQSELSVSEFNKICNMLSEYASSERTTNITLAFLAEHCEVIVAGDAVGDLGCL